MKNQLKLQPEGEIPKVTNWPMTLLYKKNHDDPSNIYCTPNKKISANMLNYFYKNNFSLISVENYFHRNNFLDDNINNNNDYSNYKNINNINNENMSNSSNINNNIKNNNNDNMNSNDNNNNNNNNNNIINIRNMNSNNDNNINNNNLNSNDSEYDPKILSNHVKVGYSAKKYIDDDKLKLIDNSKKSNEMVENKIKNSNFITSVSTEIIRSGHLRGSGRNVISVNEKKNNIYDEINWVLENKPNDVKKKFFTKDPAIYVELIKR